MADRTKELLEAVETLEFRIKILEVELGEAAIDKARWRGMAEFARSSLEKANAGHLAELANLRSTIEELEEEMAHE